MQYLAVLLDFVALVNVDTYVHRQATLHLSAARHQLSPNNEHLCRHVASEFVEVVMRPFTASIPVESQSVWTHVMSGFVRKKYTPISGIDVQQLALTSQVQIMLQFDVEPDLFQPDDEDLEMLLTDSDEIDLLDSP